MGSAEGGSPRFVPICSDFPVFFRFVPICAPCFRECPDLFRFVPFSSDLFRFVFRPNRNKSGKPLSADPFCKSPIIANFTLPGLRFHALQTRAFSSFALSRPCTSSLPGLARSSPGPRPVLAHSSPGLARPSPSPRLALAHPHFKQSSRQNRQKRNLLTP